MPDPVSSAADSLELPLPPGSMGLPLIGETLNFLFDRDYADKRRAQYGDIFKSNLLGRPTVLMMGVEANQFILSTRMDCFSWREGWPRAFQELLGESLFLQEGAEALEGYLEIMVTLTQEYCAQWEPKQTFAWLGEMKKLTFAIASQLLIGSSSGAMTDRLSQWFTELTNGLFAPPFLRWGWTPYGRALKARDALLAHLEQVINDRLQNPTQDALGLLVQAQDEHGDRLTLQELKVQALLMLFAGHETTTSLLTSLVMVFAQYPEILSRARQEQLNLVSQDPANLTTGSLTMGQLKQMPYLDQVLKEVERLFPPVGGGFRGVVKPFEFNGYRVPQGWSVLYRIDAAHKDDRYFTNPMQFDPDRFSPERAEPKRSEYKGADFSLVAFGGGPRICLGMAFAQMEMKTIAALLLRRYTWDLVPHQDLTLVRIPTLHPRSGLQVRFAPIQF
jgi:retinoid hydroxylase